jgi:hypothetical protein
VSKLFQTHHAWDGDDSRCFATLEQTLAELQARRAISTAVFCSRAFLCFCVLQSLLEAESTLGGGEHSVWWAGLQFSLDLRPLCCPTRRADRAGPRSWTTWTST